jgi:DNA-binding MarR family transcriptional regulator
MLAPPERDLRGDMAIVDMVIINMYSIRVDSSHPLTGYLVWRLSLRWRNAVDRALAPIGLTHAQYSMLASLYGLSRLGAQPSQRELAEFSGLEPMYVSKLARTAENAGQLVREANTSDPRAVRLSLTPEGRKTILAAMGLVRELHEQLLAPLGGPGSPQRDELRSMLTALLQQAETLDDGQSTD